MTHNPFELAKQQADILAEHLEPVEAALRESMLGAYALGGVSSDMLKETSEREASYVRFATETVALLPKARLRYDPRPAGYEKFKYTAQFETEDLSLPQNLFRSVVWSRCQPYYVIGTTFRRVKRKKMEPSAGLLMPADIIGLSAAGEKARHLDQSGEIRGTYLNGRNVRGWDLRAYQHLQTIVTPDMLKNQLYDKSANKFVLQVRENKGHLYPIIDTGRIDHKRISDEGMVNYNVFGHLAELAIRFSVTEQYQALLTKFASQMSGSQKQIAFEG